MNYTPDTGLDLDLRDLGLDHHLRHANRLRRQCRRRRPQTKPYRKPSLYTQK